MTIFSAVCLNLNHFKYIILLQVDSLTFHQHTFVRPPTWNRYTWVSIENAELLDLII